MDHLVVAVPVLEEGVDAVERLTGVRAIPGGSHPGWGTHNALIRLGASEDLCYLELIAPDPAQPTPAGPRPFGIDALLATGFSDGTGVPPGAGLRQAAGAGLRQAAGAGLRQVAGSEQAPQLRLVNWAARTTDIARQVELARARGYDPGDAAAMQRTRPDGSVLRWQLTTGPYETRWDGLLPFLIDWGESPHPSSGLPPGLELVELFGESPHPAETASRLAALGATLDLRNGPRQGLRAVVAGPRGTLTLT